MTTCSRGSYADIEVRKGLTLYSMYVMGQWYPATCSEGDIWGDIRGTYEGDIRGQKQFHDGEPAIATHTPHQLPGEKMLSSLFKKCNLFNITFDILLPPLLVSLFTMSLSKRIVSF